MGKERNLHDDVRTAWDQLATFWDERVEAGRTWQRGLIQPSVERLLRLVLLPAVVVAAWQVGASLGLWNPLFLPAPSRVAAAAWRLLVTGELARHFGDSLLRIAWANFIAVVVAVPLGFYMGLYRPFVDLGDGLLNLLRPILRPRRLPRSRPS